jgi:subtilisin family serine protease
MLAADVLDVTGSMWDGKLVDAVRNEYVLRMPQMNAATATSLIDYSCTTPVVREGWTLQDLGVGFFKLNAPGATQATVLAWARNKGVQSIDVNRISQASKAPNDPLHGDPSNWAFQKISAEDAWETGTGTATTIVAILDSGVDYNHPDLAANMWKNPNEVAGNNIDDDRNGVIDDIFGFNALANTGNPMDDFGHGTVVAGLVGAVGDNNIGMAGVNWAVKLMAVKVMDANGNVSIANEIRGITYVMKQKMAGQNIVAANCSFGRFGFSQQESDALTQLAATGITIVAAAGNLGNDNDVRPVYPANYGIDGLIAVAASDQNDDLTSFSDFGVNTVDLAAPGVGILSTRAAQSNGFYQPYSANSGSNPTNYTVTFNGFTINEAFVDGTSCSAAFVSGAAGLLRSLKPAASIVQVKNAILDGVDRSSGLAGRVLSGGRLNLSNSVNLVLSTTGVAPVPSFVPGQAISFIEGNQGYSLAEVRVQLDRPCDPGKSCSVWVTTRPGGSAFEGVDYLAKSGFVTFSGVETQKSFFVRIVGDRQAEQREQFAVQILAAQSKGIDPGTPLIQQVNPIILDDDYDTTPVEPGPTNPSLLPKVSVDVKRELSVGGANGQAGQLSQVPFLEGGMGTFVVSLDRASNKTVSVKYRTNQPVIMPAGTALEGVDYVAASGVVTFKPGERSKEITVKILADKLLDDNETFRVVLSAPINAEFDAAAGGGVNNVNTSSAVSATITNVIPPQTPGFQITLNYLGNVPAALRGAARWAAARWSQVIVGDLPDVIDPQTGTVVDDIVIDVQSGLLGGEPTDGAGGALANAGPEEFRTYGSRLPWKASAGIDPADATNPLLRQIVLHEFGHALGFGGYVFARNNLVNATGTGFVGANALREYRTIFRTPAALSVPLETSGGGGTAGSHWAEDTFQNELMTGYVNGATTLPLSRVTVGAMADMGYQVSYPKADAYTKPAALRAVPVAAVSKSSIRLAALVASGESATRTPAVVAAAVTVPVDKAPAARSFLSMASVLPGQTSSEGVVSGGLIGRRAFAALGRG